MVPHEVVEATDNLIPGSQATVTVSYDGVNVRFTFGIPQGIPGEVSQTNLNEAILQTSNVSNSVSFLETVFADPDAEQLRAKLNELIQALRR